MVWHENLTQEQSHAIEIIQVVALKIILGKDCPRKEDGHCDYLRVFRFSFGSPQEENA